MIALLEDFFGEIHKVEIPDETQVIVGIVALGDMVMIYPEYFDSNTLFRPEDYLQGYWSIERKDFDSIKTDIGELDLSLLLKGK